MRPPTQSHRACRHRPWYHPLPVRPYMRNNLRQVSFKSLRVSISTRSTGKSGHRACIGRLLPFCIPRRLEMVSLTTNRFLEQITNRLKGSLRRGPSLQTSRKSPCSLVTGHIVLIATELCREQHAHSQPAMTLEMALKPTAPDFWRGRIARLLSRTPRRFKEHSTFLGSFRQLTFLAM